MFILTLLSQLSFVYKTMSQISFNLFRSGDEMLLSDFMRKWSWFHGHDVRFPKNLRSKLKLPKTDAWFVDEKKITQNNYNETDIFLSLEKSRTFLLAKEKTWKRILTLTVNRCKIMQKKKVYYIFKSNKRVLHWVKE